MLGLTTVDLAVIGGYFLVITVIGVISAYVTRNREDFIMGGRRFGPAMMAMFAFGAGTHADSAVGVAAQSYKFGLAGIWYQWIMLFTLPIYWLIAPIFRRSRVLTTADLFERRFGVGVASLYSVFALCFLVFVTSMMLFASGRLIESLTGGALPWRVAIVVVGSISFLYGIAGGLIAAIWNDFLQGILTIVMSLLIIPFFWSHIGGLHGFQASLPDPHTAFRLVLSKDMTLFWIAMLSINSLVSMVAQPHIMSNTGAARTEMDSRLGFVGGMILKRLMTVPWSLTGVMAIAMFGATGLEADHAFGAMSRALLPTGVVGLMVACVMASVMDNCAVSMLSFAGIYTNSVHRKLVRGAAEESEARLVRVGRISCLVFAVIALAFSYVYSDVPSAMRFGFLVIPMMGIPFLLAVLWRRANRYGAVAAFVAALSAVLAGHFLFGWALDAGLPKAVALSLSCALIAGVVVSLRTRPEPKSKTDAFFMLLRTPVGQEHALLRAGFTEAPGSGTLEAPAEIREEDLDTAAIQPAVRQARGQAIWGAAIVAAIMLSMLLAVVLMARWMAGG